MQSHLELCHVGENKIDQSGHSTAKPPNHLRTLILEDPERRRLVKWRPTLEPTKDSSPQDMSQIFGMEDQANPYHVDYTVPEGLMHRYFFFVFGEKCAFVTK